MIRHNAHIQKLADDAAREEDFFCASYYGRIDGPCAFSRVGYDGQSFCMRTPSDNQNLPNTKQLTLSGEVSCIFDTFKH